MAGTLHFWQQDGTLVKSIAMTGILGQPRGICYLGQKHFLATSNSNVSYFHVGDDFNSLYETKQINNVHLQLPGSSQALRGICTDGQFFYCGYSNSTSPPSPNGGVAQFTIDDFTFIRTTWSNSITEVRSVCYDGNFFYATAPSVTQVLIVQYSFGAEPKLLNVVRTGGTSDILNSLEYNGKNFFYVDDATPRNLYIGDIEATKISSDTSTFNILEDVCFAPAEDFIDSPHSHWMSKPSQNYIIGVERS